LLFFSSAATKLPGYILPLIPAAALLLALFWGQIWTSPLLTPLRSWPFLISAGLNGLILLTLAIAAAISPQLIGTDPAHPALVENLQVLHLPLILASIISLNTLLFAVLAFNSHGRGWLWLPNLGFWLGALLWVLPPLGQLMDSQMQKPFRELSRTVGQVAEPQEPIWVMGYRRYSLVFYSQKPAIFLDDVQYGWELLESPKTDPRSDTVLITGDRAVIERFNLQPQDYQMLGQWGNYQLWRVAKSVLLLRKNQTL
jgi:4-amino-4-deoxy-L-arabinose transferase-like glycosyltransferase